MSDLYRLVLPVGKIGHHLKEMFDLSGNSLPKFKIILQMLDCLVEELYMHINKGPDPDPIQIKGSFAIDFHRTIISPKIVRKQRIW